LGRLNLPQKRLGFEPYKSLTWRQNPIKFDGRNLRSVWFNRKEREDIL